MSSAPQRSDSGSGQGPLPWYQNMRVIGILLVLFGVLALPLVWFNKQLELRKKIIITVVAVIIGVIFAWGTGMLVDALKTKTQEIQQERESILGQPH